MSFQAYLDAIEVKTGLTPEELLARAKDKGYTAETKASEVLLWLKDEYGLGRGHGMALFHVLKNGSIISDKHVGSDGRHADSSTKLNLKGKDYDGR